MAFLTPGETLKQIRKKLKITQEDLNSANISRNFISMVECNKRKLNRETAIKLLKILNRVAIEKSIFIDIDLDYLTLSPEEAATNYCCKMLESPIQEISILEINEVIDLSKRYELNEIKYKGYITKADILFEKNYYYKSLNYYQSSLELCIDLHKTYDLGMLYNKIGKCKIKLVNIEESLIFFEKAYIHSLESKNDICLKNSLYNIALASKKLGKIENALDAINKFIVLRNKEQYPEDYINAMILKANCAVTQKNDFIAMNIYKELEEFMSTSSNNILAGYIYNNLGVVCSNLDNIEDSLEYFSKAEKIRVQFDNKGLAHTYIDKANVFFKKNIKDGIIELIYKAINIATEHNDMNCIFEGYLLLENIYLQNNNTENLEEVYINTLNIARDSENREVLIKTLAKLAILKINKEEIDESKKFVEEILKNY